MKKLDIDQEVNAPAFAQKRTPTGTTTRPRRQDRNTYIIGMLGPCGSGKSYACSLLTSKLNQSTVREKNRLAADYKGTSTAAAAAFDNHVNDSSVIVTAHHIDTDSLAHAVYQPGSKAVVEIGKEFGEHVVANGAVDRKALGAIVFRDESKMEVSCMCNIY
jgi:hypothetical protein